LQRLDHRLLRLDDFSRFREQLPWIYRVDLPIKIFPIQNSSVSAPLNAYDHGTYATPPSRVVILVAKRLK
jgi:hypothetical protein